MDLGTPGGQKSIFLSPGFGVAGSLNINFIKTSSYVTFLYYLTEGEHKNILLLPLLSVKRRQSGDHCGLGGSSAMLL